MPAMFGADDSFAFLRERKFTTDDSFAASAFRADRQNSTHGSVAVILWSSGRATGPFASIDARTP
jgi:hypothetical protein